MKRKRYQFIVGRIDVPRSLSPLEAYPKNLRLIVPVVQIRQKHRVNLYRQCHRLGGHCSGCGNGNQSCKIAMKKGFH